MLILTKVAGVLLTPPAIVLLLTLLGLLLQLRWRLLGATLVWVGLGTLIMLSSSAVGSALLGTLEDGLEPLPHDAATLTARADAIVILGGGRHESAPEYGGDTVNEFTLERLRYGARLHRLTGLPLLVSGGAIFNEPVTEADLMQRALVEDMQVKARWVEGRSRSTYENALYSRAMLEAEGVRKVLLVTHAWHMQRALWAFRAAGLDPIAAPLGFVGHSGARPLLAYLPSANGLSRSSRATHEYVGLWWYRLRYDASRPTPEPVPG